MPDKTKILMLNYEFPPIGGGSGNATKHVLKEMAERDVEIDLVTSSIDEYKEEDISENIRLYRLNVSKKQIHEWKQLEIARYMVKGIIKSKQLNRKNNYDLIHAWSGFPCGLMAKILGKPYLVGLRGADVPGYSNKFQMQYLLLKPLIKNVWKSADYIIPNSENLRQLAEQTLDIDMEIIPNGVDTEKFKPGKSKSEKVRVVCVSRLTGRKRVIDVIKAVEDLDDVELVLVGEGEESRRLETYVENKGIENKVDFRGYISHSNLPAIYKGADIFVLPSLNEGMSNSLLESMASGLPVIVTQTGGTKELVDGNGEIVPKRDPEAIKQKIKTYRENPRKIEEHGENSRRIAENMSWEKVADRYMEKYEEIGL